MTTTKRTRAAKKAVAPPVDDPSTPHYDARAEDGTFAKEADDAQPDEAVAASTPTPPTCRRHGNPAVYVSDGRATAAVAYCSRCLPANVTQVMVEAYQVRLRASA